jgi:hypothetical protein
MRAPTSPSTFVVLLPTHGYGPHSHLLETWACWKNVNKLIMRIIGSSQAITYYIFSKHLIQRFIGYAILKNVFILLI